MTFQFGLSASDSVVKYILESNIETPTLNIAYGDIAVLDRLKEIKER